MKKKELHRGGKRKGAGRPRTGLTTKMISLKLDLDLYNALPDDKKFNRNRYINNSLRQSMLEDGFLKGIDNDDKKDK